jgi:hypothetical protein
MSSIRNFCKQLKKSIVSQVLMGSENLLQLTSEVAGGVKRAKEAQFPKLEITLLLWFQQVHF